LRQLAHALVQRLSSDAEACCQFTLGFGQGDAIVDGGCFGEGSCEPPFEVEEDEIGERLGQRTHDPGKVAGV
jgi:hypothetical protein